MNLLLLKSLRTLRNAVKDKVNFWSYFNAKLSYTKIKNILSKGAQSQTINWGGYSPPAPPVPPPLMWTTLALEG